MPILEAKPLLVYAQLLDRGEKPITGWFIQSRHRKREWYLYGQAIFAEVNELRVLEHPMNDPAAVRTIQEDQW